MDKEMKREALRQYFKYFRIWFIITGVIVLITACVVVEQVIVQNAPRGNSLAPAERVYDYANVLTAAEEDELRTLIAKYEKKCHVDIIIVTLDQEMGLDDRTWETNMMNFADDFYDDRKYGWDMAYGDGALLLDNWYEDERGSQKGSWLSTSGKMERIIGAYEEGSVFDAMDVYIDSNPYKAYRAAVQRLAQYGGSGVGFDGAELGAYACLLFIPFVVALIYALVNLNQSKAKDTTAANTYVENGKPVLRSRADDFIRKNVVSHRIETSSGSSGGSHHSGGGSHGSHRSSSGHSHGGGGRRR